MTEIIFNFYAYVKSDRITEMGVFVHSLEGSDDEKMKFLREHVISDLEGATRFPLPKGFEIIGGNDTENALAHDLFNEMLLNGSYMHLLEPVLGSLNAPAKPLMCITCVVDGAIVIDDTRELTTKDPGSPPQFVRQRMSDWLIEYTSPEGLDIPNLLNDDFLKAVKLLYNDGRYVSALKLKLSFVDTIAFLEYGDIPSNFQTWLNNYCDLSPLEITADELWELRNSILHMTNLESRKVLRTKVRGIGFYVTGQLDSYHRMVGETHSFNFPKLIEIIGIGLSRWLNTYTIDLPKRELFVERYDSLVSDIRNDVRFRL